MVGLGARPMPALGTASSYVRARTESRDNADRKQAERDLIAARSGSQGRFLAPAVNPEAVRPPDQGTATGVRRCRTRAAVPASGATRTTANRASERAQPPTPKLSTGMFAIAQPTKMPGITALAKTPTHAARDNLLGWPSKATTAKTALASRIPASACQSQCGWFDTGLPQANFALRVSAVISPQWPPTVPSRARFQGWS